MSDTFEDLFVFEMANNHQGDLEHGLDIVSGVGGLARKHSIRAAVKLQYRDLDTLIHPDFKTRQDVPHIPRFMSTRLTDAEFLTLTRAVAAQGMTRMATPFDETSVEQCLRHDIEIIKVASCSATDWPLLEVVAETNKPVVVSTGGLSVADVDSVVSFLTHRGISFALMHCVAVYPAPSHTLRLDSIRRMIRRYPGVAVGYSGHESGDNTEAVQVAVSKGASILERHVGIPTNTIELNAYSMTLDQTDAWIGRALAAKEMGGGSKDRSVQQTEAKALLSLKRGVYADRSIDKGAVIGREDVFFAMPCAEGQTTAGEFGQYRAQFLASRDYQPGEAVNEYWEPDTVATVRAAIHRIKGMLSEAGITVGDGLQIQLSHHYGMAQFQQFGALIVNTVNREYCKKLIVVLPDQVHPNHHHRLKEETFQVLSGDLTVNLAGVTRELKAGDRLLVGRREWHTFTSRKGAIVEEISSTHIDGDSYYEDKQIGTQDPMVRKTVIDEW